MPHPQDEPDPISRRALSPITEFALLARVPDESLDLERIAASIARMGTPALDPATLSAELDHLAESVADLVDPCAAPDRLAQQLAFAFGRRLGFRGSPDAYRLADGSLLHRVVESRTGLPILLGVVWILLGRRLGVPVAGVNYPGHFLTCIEAPGARLYCDPFRGGQAADVRELVARLPPGTDRRALEPAGVRPIAVRMLTNLKHLWIDQKELPLALGAVDRILLLAGEVPQEVRDRGLLATHLGRPHEARRDLERYLQIAPDAGDREDVEKLLTGAGEG
jgi:regulator of sirC expression with transglutaminase-like and TPR domain